jgi:hypothetical protein
VLTLGVEALLEVRNKVWRLHKGCRLVGWRLFWMSGIRYGGYTKAVDWWVGGSSGCQE